MNRGIVIVGCGARKLDHRAPAGELYTGSYFRACMATARELWPPGRIFILSALCGLVPQALELNPYNLTIGQPGSITSRELRVQAWERGMLGTPVTALCGARYVAVIRDVWPYVITPLAGLGIGQQRHELATMRGDRDGQDLLRPAR